MCIRQTSAMQGVGLNQALLDHGLVEACHRRRLIVTLAGIYGLQKVLQAADVLLSQLVSSQTEPRPPIAGAVNALSFALDRTFE